MSLSSDIRKALAQLELVSHAPIQGYDFAPPAEGRKERWRTSSCCARCRKAGLETCGHRDPVPHLGQHSSKGGDTKTPMGSDREHPRDPQERFDLADSYHGKTVAHFRARIERDGESEEILRDIRKTVKAWRVQQIPEGHPPALGDPQWKKWVAENPASHAEMARLFSVTGEYIRQVRKAYKEESE